jgi:hypothetical protein
MEGFVGGVKDALNLLKTTATRRIIQASGIVLPGNLGSKSQV